MDDVSAECEFETVSILIFVISFWNILMCVAGEIASHNP